MDALDRWAPRIRGRIGFFHLLLDAVSGRICHRTAASVPLFLVDQPAHLLLG